MSYINIKVTFSNVPVLDVPKSLQRAHFQTCSL